MLRSWRESSRALAAIAAGLSLASSLLATEPALLWQSPAEQRFVIAQAQHLNASCISGNCPNYYGSPEEIPAPVVTPAPQYEIILTEPGGEVIYGDPSMPGCCDGVTGDFCGDLAAGCCDCWCPLWTFHGEALFYGRGSSSNVPLVSAPVIVNSADLDLGWAVGPRVSAIRHGVWGTCWDAEVAYFGIWGFSDTLQLADIDNYLTNPNINVGGATPGTLSYDSSLQSGEVNLRRVYGPALTWLVGFRWIDISEDLSSDFGGVASHNTSVSNTLLGGQLGLDALLWDNGANFTLSGLGKVGVFGNDVNQTTTTAGVGGALPLIATNGGQASFLGELGLNARYQWTDRLSLVGGYNLLWITGVGLAPDQLATTNIVTGVATVNSDGTAFYHGANVGLELAW